MVPSPALELCLGVLMLALSVGFTIRSFGGQSGYAWVALTMGIAGLGALHGSLARDVNIRMLATRVGIGLSLLNVYFGVQLANAVSICFYVAMVGVYVFVHLQLQAQEEDGE